MYRGFVPQHVFVDRMGGVHRAMPGELGAIERAVWDARLAYTDGVAGERVYPDEYIVPSVGYSAILRGSRAVDWRDRGDGNPAWLPAGTVL